MKSKRKRVPLTKKEQVMLRDFVYSEDTKHDACVILGVTYQTLRRVMLVGFGSPETIMKIRQTIHFN